MRTSGSQNRSCRYSDDHDIHPHNVQASMDQLNGNIDSFYRCCCPRGTRFHRTRLQLIRGSCPVEASLRHGSTLRLSISHCRWEVCFRSPPYAMFRVSPNWPHLSDRCRTHHTGCTNGFDLDSVRCVLHLYCLP